MGAISGMGGGNKIVRIIFRERKVPRLFCLFVCLERKVALLFRSCLFEKEKNKEEEIGVGFCVLFLGCFFFLCRRNCSSWLAAFRSCVACGI